MFPVVALVAQLVSILIRSVDRMQHNGRKNADHRQHVSILIRSVDRMQLESKVGNGMRMDVSRNRRRLAVAG